MRSNIYGVFDTETIGLKEKFTYDLGLVIIGKRGAPLFKKRWIIAEVMNIPNITKKAFYGEKIATSNIYKYSKSVSFAQARFEFRELLDRFDVNMLTAYNLNFDKGALTDTLEFTGLNGKFLHKAISYFDLWNACCNSFFKQKQYQNMAIEHDWISPAGNFRTNAEVAYRFITKNPSFVEEHTALEDAVIEAEILQEVLRQKKKREINSIIWHPWRKAQVA